MTVTNSETKPANEGSQFGNNESGRGIWLGVFLLIIGGVALAKSFLLPIPHWLFNWQMLLIVIGLFIGVRNKFQGASWLIMIVTGASFLLNDYYFSGELRRHLWPLLLIIIGVIYILRPRNRRWQQKEKWTAGQNLHLFQDQENLADMTVFFGSAKKKMLTRNFAGGDITAIFAGAELDLTQSDMQGTAVIDITAIFGGAELIVPSDWTVKSEIVSVFGAVKDKRIQSPEFTENPAKTLVLDGTALFGGIEIRSFPRKMH